MNTETIYKQAAMALWAITLIIVTSGVNKMDRISESVNDLNKNVAVIIEQTNFNVKKIDDHEGRLRFLEKTSQP